MVSEQVHIVTQSEVTPEAWDGVLSAPWRSPKLLFAWAKAMAAGPMNSGWCPYTGQAA